MSKTIFITGATSGITGMMYYNNVTKEVKYTTAAKSFIIDHPTDKDKYLVHACLEGPESGVYYRGKGKITNNEYTTILLPDYLENLATDLTVQVTSIHSKSRKNKNILETSEIENNSFTVYGENGDFYWLVLGKRCDVDVEPLKISTIVKGAGPYKWI
jgi:hypothetical protein